MTVHKTAPELRTHDELYQPESTWRSTVEWVAGIIGAVALFLGLFITFAGENQSLGLGGDWSWEVGEISSAWQYGFLIGGAVLLLGVIGLVIQGRMRK